MSTEEQLIWPEFISVKLTDLLIHFQDLAV